MQPMTQIMNNPATAVLFTQAANNFQYWTSGKEDPKPVSISWLDSTFDFRNAQKNMATQMKNDVLKQLSQMKNGESRTFQKSYTYAITSPSKIGPIPTDFAVAVGRANTAASVDFVIKKSFFGNSVRKGDADPQG